jgi:hypothetical protein
MIEDDGPILERRDRGKRLVSQNEEIEEAVRILK